VGAAIAGLAALSLGLYLSRPEPLDLSRHRFTPVVTEAEPANWGSWSPDASAARRSRIRWCQAKNGPRPFVEAACSAAATKAAEMLEEK